MTDPTGAARRHPCEPRPTPLVGRLAPSPTGDLHLGHARTFLLAWWSLRARGGRVLLRIEDLDTARAVPGSTERILEDLRWLGLDWDGEPHLQSAGPEPTLEALGALVTAGLAYPCTCSRREIESIQSAPHASDGTLRYPGTCRDRWGSVQEAEAAAGRPAGIRLRVPSGPVHWQDALLGPQSHDVAADVGDFLLARRDGVLGYQLSVVVDDARQGVTEVLRGADLVPSTARQALLLDALGLPRPIWLHVPLVLDADGRRLAKRDTPRSLASLRATGVDPLHIVHWAARSAGLALRHPPAQASDVLPHFERGHLATTPVRLTPRSLSSLLPNAPPQEPPRNP